MTPELAVYLTLWLVTGGANALKGKWWMLFFSAGIIGVITAFRVAKPGSYWDRHWSSVAAHEKALGRFTKHGDVATALPPMP